MNGDGLDDMIHLDSLTGAPTAKLNAGPSATAPFFGWTWNTTNNNLPLTTPLITSPSKSPASFPQDQVHFADVDGDGKADLIVVSPETGAVTKVSLGSGPPSWTWKDVNVTFPGVPSGRLGRGKVNFVDLDGDGKAEYIHVNQTGSVTVWKNGFDAMKPHDTFAMKMDALSDFSVDQPAQDIDFHDVDGDGKADMLWKRSSDGTSFSSLLQEFSELLRWERV